LADKDEEVYPLTVGELLDQSYALDTVDNEEDDQGEAEKGEDVGVDLACLAVVEDRDVAVFVAKGEVALDLELKREP
jgi:hypothetical protein